jgi:hypothetical protein
MVLKKQLLEQIHSRDVISADFYIAPNKSYDGLVLVGKRALVES